MKKLKKLLLLPSLLLAQTLFAQTTAHLKLSDEHPAAGEKVSFTYDPTGTALEGKADIRGTIYYIDNKDNPADDIDLKSDGKILKGDLSVPDAAVALFLKFNVDQTIDDNGNNGYFYLIYKDGKPVKGAYAAQAWFFNVLGVNYAGTKSDKEKAIANYQKEIDANPLNNEFEETYYSMIANNSKYKTKYDQKLESLRGKTDESELMLSYRLFSNINAINKADSIKQILNKNFPANDLNKDVYINKIVREQNPEKKDSLFADLKNRFQRKVSDAFLYDYINSQLALSFVKQGNQNKYEKYLNAILNKSYLAGMLNDFAWNSAEDGKNLGEAEKLSKQSVDMLQGLIDHPIPTPFTPKSLSKKGAQFSWNASADTYAYILWKEGKSSEALPYMKKVYDLTSTEVNSIEHYSQILAGVGQYAEAINVIEKGFRDGQSSQVTKDELKKDYIKVKGSDAGFEQYLASLEAIAKAKTLADLAKTMINQPAPAFTLKDLDGNTVSLSDLKGKVVIVDFWATWCGPCKASFPGMQLAVNKYKDDPNVKFLFIDTWENGKDYEAGVRKFITANNYTFHVLIDEKNDAGRQAKVVTAFDVSGIPTKFVIDKTGNIRFKYIGYSGSSDKVLDEVVNMIELTANPQLADVKASAPEKGSK